MYKLGPLRVAATGLAAALVLTLSACGGGSTTTAPGGAASDSAPAVTADQKLFEMLPDDVKTAKKVKVGTEALYAPYEYLDADGSTVIGLDVELLKATTQRLGITYDLSNTAFDGLLPGLDSGRFDLAWAAFSDTKARQAKFDFVDYFKAGQAIVVPTGNANNIHAVADLCGRPVSVLTSSAQEALLKQFNGKECSSNKINIISQQSDTDALLQVQSKRADASFTQEPVGRYNASKIAGGKAFEVANTEALYPTLLGVAVTKKESQLRDALQAAIQSLIDDGTYDKILAARQLENGKVTKITINGSTS
jgi:polar amino acid transport system substrate-binding protein